MNKRDVVCVCMYDGLLFSHKENEILPFIITWMDLEGIMLREISQRKTNIVCYKLYVEPKKYKKLKEKNTNTTN